MDAVPYTVGCDSSVELVKVNVKVTLYRDIEGTQEEKSSTHSVHRH
jgi:hypothetical protein